MYVVVHKAKLRGDAAEAVQRTRDHIVPLVQGKPGFRGYCAFVAEQDAAYSVSVFDDKDTAMDAHRSVRQWVEANMRDLMPEAPEVVAGETVFDSIAHPQEQRQDSEESLFVVIRTYHGLPGQTETMHSLVSQHTLPAIIDSPGFRGFYAFRDEAEPDRAVSITLFENRDEALRAHERVVGIMRDRLGEMAYEPPHVTQGETAVLAAV